MQPPRSFRAVVALAAVLSITLSLGVPAAQADAGTADDPCPGLTAVPMPDGTVFCTHGDDEHLGTHVAADGTSTAPLRQAAAQCISDGRDGYRVSVLYVHPNGAPNRLGEMEGRIRRDVAQVEAMVVDSAASQGGRRHVRWETEATSNGCRPVIRSVGVPREALQDIGSTVRALAERGYGRTDRRYALYVDHDRYCGIATMPRDARPGPDNSANRQAGYARVDLPCWNRGDTGGYTTMAHELFHSLGAVQPGAPNATPAGHCSDEWDPLCYDDGSGAGTHVRCRAEGGSQDLHHRSLDCGADDYFALAPPKGSYLDRHWNTANSPYLSDAPGRGAGGGPAKDVKARWPAAHGTFRPSSTSAGFDACDLPIGVATRAGSGGLLGGSSADSGLQAAARDVVARVNQLAGTTVLELVDPVTSGAPEVGTILLDRTTGRTATVQAWTRDGRTRRALVGLPGDRPSSATALPPVLEALGLGSVPWGDGATGRLGGGGTDGTRTALRHLYVAACGQPVQLDVHAPGHPSQLTAVADRRPVDLAASAASAVALGVEVSAWLRGQPGAGSAPRAVVCRDDVAADCLAGAGLLADGGSLLFVPGGPRGSLPEAVRAELARTVQAGGEVVVLGGEDAIAPRVVSQLREGLPGRSITRLSGRDRYATAATVARRVAPHGADRVLLARGDNPADATAAAGVATRDRLPVLLTTPHGLSAPAADYLRDTGSRRVLLLGGSDALTAQVDRDVSALARGVRIAGATRTSTAVRIARSSELWGRTAVTGNAAVVGVPGYGDHAWQVALAAAPVAAHLDAPITYLAPGEVPVSEGGDYDTAEFLSGLPVRGTGRVVATSVVVGARLGGLQSGVAPAFHALFLPALRDRVQLVAE